MGTELWIRAYRVIMPLMAWILVLVTDQGQYPPALIVVTAFATLQLISFVSAFLITGNLRLRGVFWATELILLAVAGIMVWQNPGDYGSMEVLVVLFTYPALVLIYRIITRLAGAR